MIPHTTTIRNAQGEIVNLTVHIAIIPPDAPVQHALSIQLQPNGSSRVVFSGVAGRIYRIQASDALADPAAWITRATVVAADDGSFSFLDAQPLPAARFYRAVFP